MNAPPRPRSAKPRSRATPPGRRRPRWLAALAYVGLALACVVLAGASFLVVAAPTDLVRDRVIQQLQARTGRDVAAGPATLTFFPRFTVSFSGLSFAAPADMPGAAGVTVGGLEAEVGLASLFTGEPKVRRVVLTQPVIDLTIDAQGRRSWEFAAGSGESPAPSNAPVRGAVPSAAAAPMPTVRDHLGLESVRIVDGTVRFIDERVGRRHELRSLAVDVVLDGLAGPVQVKGTFALNGETVALDGTLSQLRALLEEQHARLSLKLAGRLAAATYEGVVGIRGSPTLEGNVTLKTASVQAAATWLGQPVAASRDLGAADLSGTITAADGRVSLASVEATLGGTAVTGSLALDAKGPRPHVSGALQLTALDVGRLLLRPGAGPRPPDASPGAAPRPPAEPRARDKAGRTDKPAGEWSDDTIDLTPLGLADANLALSVDRVVYKDLTTGPGKLTLALKNKIAAVTLDGLDLYGGRVRGIVILDGSGDIPTAGVDLALESVSALPLLKDALGFEWLDGRGNITVATTGRGASERQIIASLNGKVAIAMANGAVAGVDIGKILRSVEQARFGDLSPSPADRTQFSQLSGTFAIADGVAQNQDLKLVSPRLQVAGSGMANLGLRTIDYTARAKIAGSAPGEAKPAENKVLSFGTLEVPVHIEGAWQSPKVTVAGQEQIVDTVKQIGKNLRSPEVQDAIRGLLGGNNGEQKVKPRELLEKLLKKPE